MKRKTLVCKECNERFESIEKGAKFCCLPHAISFNNKRRNLTEKTKAKIALSLKDFHKENEIVHEYECDKCGSSFKNKRRIRQDRKKHCSNCKRKTVHSIDLKNVESILALSKRTVSKILRRMDIGCSNCGWNKCVCDIHHIVSRHKKGSDDHENLSYLCPNCHRMAHDGLIAKESIVTLQTYIGSKWKEYYNIKNGGVKL